MVRHLEVVCVQFVRRRGDDLRFLLQLRVAHEERRALGRGQAQHERVVVLILLVERKRPQHLERAAAARVDHIARPEPRHVHIQRVGGLDRLMLVIALFIVHFSRVYRVDLNAAFGQLDHPAAVILVGVREEHALQMRHIQRLKIAFQRVKLLFQSGVDQIVAFAQPHQNRVGLAHIEGNDLDVQAVRFRFSGNRATAQQEQRRQQRRQRPLGI